MCECRPPSALLSAGAITSANRIGVIIGTAIWRGLCAVSATRRPARVCMARAVMSMVLWSGGHGEALAGQPQVDVVECRPARADRTGRQACTAERADGVGGARVV